MTKAARVPDYLAHISKAIERIFRFTADLTDTEFLADEMVQDAVLRNIEIIGEASNNVQRVDAEFAARHDDIPWSVMYTMRNRVSLVWRTVRGDLPHLHARIKQAQLQA